MNKDLHNIFSKVALIIAMMAVGSQAYGVPAKPKPIVRVQPDGTEITIMIHGDERGHYILSDDGHLLMSQRDALYYAQIDAQGQVGASDMLARPAAMRSAIENAYLASFNTDTALSMLEVQQASNSRLVANPISTVRAKAAVSRSDDEPSEHSQSYGLGLFPNSTFPAAGSPRGLVVLVSFTDLDFTVDDPNDYFYRFLNESGFSDYDATGSVRDYFIHCSDSIFQPVFDLYGPVLLDNEMAYYGANDKWGEDQHAEDMIIEACDKLDSTVDFSVYDCDQDGYIDNIYVIYAGYGEASTALDDTVWPHSWDITSAYPTKSFIYDGVQLDHYACSNELEYEGSWTDKRPDGIGTFVHEFSHVLGLPDLYATSYSSAFTPAEWSVLDTGSYNNCSRTPPQYSIFERNALQWCSPIILDKTEYITVPTIDNNVGYIIETLDANEFFLLENRQLEGWDAYLPGHGMLIWHVDYNEIVWNNNTVNNTSSHQYVDLVEADNQLTELTRSGDSWPGTGNRTYYSYTSSPKLRTWDKDSLDIAIYDIEENDGLISFLCQNTSQTDDPGAGITDVTTDNGSAILTTQGAVKGMGEGILEVYSIDGRLAGRCEANQWLSVSPGTYIVRQGDSVTKIRVR